MKNDRQDYLKKYRMENKEKTKKYQNIYYQQHKEGIKKQHKEYRKINRYKIMKQGIKYRESHKEQIKKHSQESKEHRKEYAKKYHQNHKEHLNELNRKYYKEHKEHLLECVRKWKKTKRGAELSKECFYKRRRNKKWIEILPNIFPSNIPVDYHHIDGKMFVVPIPSYLHRHWGANLKKHLETSNGWINFYYGINPMDILKEENDASMPKL